MLSKDICKRCVSEKFLNSPWCKGDEKRWDRGDVFCVVEFSWQHCVAGEPPKDCTYFLEQTLYSMSQAEGKQDAQ